MPTQVLRLLREPVYRLQTGFRGHAVSVEHGLGIPVMR